MSEVPRPGQLRVVTSAGFAGVCQWGSGPPDVVLLHGAGGNRQSLVPLGDELAAVGVQAMTVSMSGRDGSDGDGIGTIAGAAAWLAELLGEVAPGGTVLLGHSMGGGIAIETALTTGARLHGLVLAATGARLRVLPAILDLADRLAATDASHGDLAVAALQPDAAAELRDHLRAAAALTPTAVMAGDWHAVDAFDRLDAVGDLDLPVLAIAGDQDHLTPVRYAQYLADHAPSAELVVLPGAGHEFPIEEAAHLAGLVAAFLGRLDRQVSDRR